MKYIISFLILIITDCLVAQHHSSLWFFGNNAGLDFTTNPPTPLTSPLQTLEGTSSISDKDGNLLFYTNGATVWDRNHDVLMNGSGMTGGSSSTQAALIVPEPGSCGIYYLFTTEDHTTDGGLYYSVIDMCLNNGLGGVVPGKKNILMEDRTCEKLAAVKHANGKDVWILSHRMQSDDFLAFSLSSNGISLTPVVSSVGSFYGVNAFIGPLKASHNGKQLASSASFYNICELFDFNASTGQITNARDLRTHFSGSPYFYGIEFSPNDSLLYLSSFWGTSRVFQLNLNNFQVTTLRSISGDYNIGGLQLGPDGKIYVSRNNSPFLDVVRLPDLKGMACAYTSGDQSLASGTTAQLGLPNFIPYIDPYFSIENLDVIGDSTICDGDTLLISLNLNQACSPEILWSNGSSDDFIEVSESGKYSVEISNMCLSIIDSSRIDFVLPPVVEISDIQICQDTGYLLHIGTLPYEYQWFDGSNSPSVLLNAQGTYWIDVSNDCFMISDSFEFMVYNPIQFDLKDTVLCSGESTSFQLSFPDASILWSTLETDNLIHVEEPGHYWVEVVTSCETIVDSFLVEFVPPVIGAINDTVLCLGDTINMQIDTSSFLVVWPDGSTNGTYAISNPGLYSVNLSNPCFNELLSFEVIAETNPVIIIPDSSICTGDTLLIPLTGEYIFNLNTEEISGDLIIYNGGQYIIGAENSCGMTFDTFFISEIGIPEVSLMDTVLCDGESILLDAYFPGSEYVWSNGSIDSAILVDVPGIYSVNVFNDCFESMEAVVISQLDYPFIHIEDTTICIDELFQINLDIPNVTLMWSDNSASSFFSTLEEGIFWVEAVNKCGIYSDTFLINRKDCEVHIYVPNVFTPNGDGINDEFFLSSNVGLNDLRIIIFDRWGNNVFISTESKPFWDGTFRGLPCMSGVYAYAIEGFSDLGGSFSKTGSITLVR